MARPDFAAGTTVRATYILMLQSIGRLGRIFLRHIDVEDFRMPEASKKNFITADEREEIESLIRSFDNHGCGFGLDLKAQVALRRLLDALGEAELALDSLTAKTG